ncbi:uncharacterized protein LOC116343378 [Contarinia nasturtii]|uniref:uncharacterized protein LOC116343378 n=1 Tax=Contarinia nasturtii TaxID=265458 RepID=UPI0012D461CF|nr:uncharacterized protein LOC116343378 [Contarinia nasturtii]
MNAKLFFIVGAIILGASLVMGSDDTCKKDCPENQKFVCGGGSCLPTCRTQYQECCIRNIMAPRRCYPIDGYAINKDGKSIPINSAECQKEALPKCKCNNGNCENVPA